MRPVPNPGFIGAGQFRASGRAGRSPSGALRAARQKGSTMARQRKTELRLPSPEYFGFKDVPLDFANTLALGVAIIATQDGAHRKCGRRDCRNMARCRAATAFGRSDFCTVPVRADADRRLEAMFLFLLQLAYGWR